MFLSEWPTLQKLGRFVVWHNGTPVVMSSTQPITLLDWGACNMYNMQEFMEWHEYLEIVDKFADCDKMRLDELEGENEDAK